LNEEILNEWEFWKAVKKNSNFLIFENNLSFKDLQIYNAVIDMEDDYENAINEFHKQELDRTK